jgi:parallel beta-helix repeat protein
VKQVLQNSAGTTIVRDVPAPVCQPTSVLVRNEFSVISSGTERSRVEGSQKSILSRAIEQPELVLKVADRARREGIRHTQELVRKTLTDESGSGYSSAGTVIELGAAVRGLALGDRVACAGAGYANHAEIVSIPRNLCAKVPASVPMQSAALTMSAENAAHFSVGSTIQITDPGKGLETGSSFVTRVAKIEGGTITLEEPSPVTALLVNTSVAYLVTPVKGIWFEDLTIVVAPGATPHLVTLLEYAHYEDCGVRRVRILREGANPMAALATAGSFNGGRNFQLLNCELDGIIGAEALATNRSAQGFYINNTTAANVEGNHVRRSASGITLEGSPWATVKGNRLFGRTDALGRAIRVEKQSNHSTLDGNVCDNYQAKPEEEGAVPNTCIHVEDTGHTTVVGNTVSNTGGPGIALPSTVGGANFRTHHNNVEGNVISNTGTLALPAGAVRNEGIRVGVGEGITEALNGDNYIGDNVLDTTGGIGLLSSRNTVGPNKIVNTKTYAAVHSIANTKNNTIHPQDTKVNAVSAVDTSASAGENTIFIGSPGTALPTAAVIPATSDYVTQRTYLRELTDEAKVMIDATSGSHFFLSAGGSRTMEAPTHGVAGMRITIEIKNNTGGAITTTWNAAFEFAGATAPTDPATGKRRLIVFEYGFNGKWQEISKSSADLA